METEDALKHLLETGDSVGPITVDLFFQKIDVSDWPGMLGNLGYLVERLAEARDQLLRSYQGM